MKSALRKILVAVAGVTLLPLLWSAQTGSNPPPILPLPEWPAGSQGKRDWEDLVELRKQAEPDGRITDRAEARMARIAGNHSVADKAKEFYTRHPGDALAAEARRVEILSLIDALEAGDASSSGRLEGAVSVLRSNNQIPTQIRAQGVAAFEFTRGLRDVRGFQARLDATERIARDLIREFPGESPPYEALWAVARARPQEESAKLAREILTSDAQARFKAAAQTLLDRYALLGRDLKSALDESGLKALAKLSTGMPLIVYSWSTSEPGSLEFGRMIQARRFAALGVCLDEDTEAAGKVARSLGLGGEHLFDDNGLQGLAVARLKFSAAGQIYLVDEAGVIRDVRGGEDLEAKLAALGFRTPVINPTPEQLRP